MEEEDARSRGLTPHQGKLNQAPQTGNGQPEGGETSAGNGSVGAGQQRPPRNGQTKKFSPYPTGEF